MADRLDLDGIQAAIRHSGLAGWLFFDHHRRDLLAYRVLHFEPAQTPTRRWYYFIPAEGEPTKIQHRIEPHVIDLLPGRVFQYAGWREHHKLLRELLPAGGKVAMQYSPECNVPYVAMVDAGTIELIRRLGVEVVSSADLVQLFEARWNGSQIRMHLEAGRRVDAIRRAAFDEIAAHLEAGRTIGEFDVKQFILSSFDREGLVTDHGPIVAVNAHASDPHYEPTAASSIPIQQNDVVLIDLWAKLREPGAVYYDITWTGFCGSSVPSEVDNVFEVVAGARDAAITGVQDAISRGESVRGCDVDDLARSYIGERGFGESFFHRTGHSIGEDVHGTGANMDNYETHDERLLIPGCCFSIEPGVYLPRFGIRSEVNMLVEQANARVTGEIQRQVLRLA